MRGPATRRYRFGCWPSATSPVRWVTVPPGIGTVAGGDARQLPRLLAGQLDQRAALVLTSPPYGSWAHGRVRTRREDGNPQGKVRKWNTKYTSGPSRANLATAGEAALLDGMVEILAACGKVLRPGGLVVLTARPWRRGGVLVDFPGALEHAAVQAGLVLVERAVALLAGLRDQRLVPAPRSSRSTTPARLAPPGCPCRSSRTRTCSSSPHQPGRCGRDRQAHPPPKPAAGRRPVGPGLRLQPARYVALTPEQEREAITALARLLALVRERDQD